MKSVWKVGIASVAIIVLAGAAVGLVSAQTDSEVPGSDFVSRLAEKLGISQDELEKAIDETQLDMVDEAVAQDRLTEQQADRIRERIESGEGFMPFGGFRRGFAAGWGLGHLAASADDIADFLGISTEELRNALADGQSLAQVAEANGSNSDALQEFLLSKVEERVAAAVEDGKITQEQADQILEDAPQRIEDMVTREGPLWPEGGGPGHWRGGFGQPCEPEADDTSGTTF